MAPSFSCYIYIYVTNAHTVGICGYREWLAPCHDGSGTWKVSTWWLQPRATPATSARQQLCRGSFVFLAFCSGNLGDLVEERE